MDGSISHRRVFGVGLLAAGVCFLAGCTATPPSDAYEINKSPAGKIVTGESGPRTQEEAWEEIREENEEAAKEGSPIFMQDREDF